MIEETYAPPELANAWGVKPEKIIAWIRSGDLAAFNISQKKLGRPRYRITKSAAEAFIQQRSVVPTQPTRRAARPRNLPTPSVIWV